MARLVKLVIRLPLWELLRSYYSGTNYENVDAIRSACVSVYICAEHTVSWNRP